MIYISGESRMKKILVSLFVLLGLIGAGPAVSEQAPNFSLPDSEGREHSLSELKGHMVVLEWLNPDCPFVKRHHDNGTMKKLSEKYAAQGVKWLGINSTYYMDAKENAASKNKWSLSYPILSDKSGAVGKLFGAKTTPFMVVIDKSGEIIYRGAIDDDPRGNNSENPVNYVALALDAALGGKKIEVAMTKSYGCSVKYAS